jgi:hypothetical protein
MIFQERNRNGSITLSALVSDSQTPFDWYERQTYYDYTLTEAKRLFKQHLTDSKMTLKKDTY